MKTAIAILMGSCSGLLISIIGSWVFFALNFGGTNTTILGLGCFVGGWMVSSCFLLLGARTLSKVLGRGFLLGAVEWLLMIGGGVIRASRMETMDGVETMIAASAMVSLPMAALCLIGFAIAHFWRRKMEPELSKPGKRYSKTPKARPQPRKPQPRKMESELSTSSNIPPLY